MACVLIEAFKTCSLEQNDDSAKGAPETESCDTQEAVSGTFKGGGSIAAVDCELHAQVNPGQAVHADCCTSEVVAASCHELVHV